MRTQSVLVREAGGEAVQVVADAFDAELVQAMWDVPTAELEPGTYGWRVELLPQTVGPLRRVLDRWPVSFDDAALLALHSHEVRYEQLLALSRATRSWLSTTYPRLGRDLRPWQEVVVDYARSAIDRGGIYIGDDTGLGKTTSALAIAADIGAWPAVAVVPPSAWLLWAREIRAVLPDRSVALLSSLHERRNPLADEGIDLLHSTRSMLMHDLFVVTYPNLTRWAPALARRGIGFLIADEAHLLAHRTALRTRTSIALAKKVPFTVYLSGTGAPNGRTVEFMPQLEALGRFDDLGGREFLNDRYLRTTRPDVGPGRIPASVGTPEELNTAMRSVCYVRRTKADVWPLLPAVDWVDVPHLLSEWDYQLHTDLRSEARRARGPALLPIVEQSQARVARAKLRPFGDWLSTWLDTTDGKMVIWADHRLIVEALAAEHNSPFIIGGMGQEHRDHAIRRFQEGNARLIVASLDANREAITLTAGHYASFIETGWTPMVMDQAVGRQHGRTNDPHGLTAYVHYVPGTVDSIIMRRVAAKRDRHGRITDGRSILTDVAAEFAA